MIDYQLNIGDVAISTREANYSCYGLGSCIGLFILDRLTGISGGAHILLPESEKGPSDFAKYYNVTEAIDEILMRMKFTGNPLTSLRAKIVGGANVVPINCQTGQRNIQSVIKHLTDRKIFIAASDVGGTYCRSAKFESSTGLLTVRIPQINEYKIY
jgi:chemotaxis protein CheD